MVDTLLFPTLSAYLSRLPDGLDSYPQCQAKGSMVISALEHHDLGPVLSHLPAELVELAGSPPPATRWLPLAHSESIFHAVCDRFYPKEADVIDWCYRRTWAMAKSPMYRRLGSVAGPRFFLRIAASVHRMFERGTSMTVAFSDASSARVELQHPPHAHSPLNKVSNVGMLRAIVEMTGGVSPDCKMTRCGPEGAVFDCTWE